jgi:hypothetical protein
MDNTTKRPFFWIKLPFGLLYYVDDPWKMIFSSMIMSIWIITLIFFKASAAYVFIILAVLVIAYAYERRLNG